MSTTFSFALTRRLAIGGTGGEAASTGLCQRGSNLEV
jgi:hypothetical protein